MLCSTVFVKIYMKKLEKMVAESLMDSCVRLFVIWKQNSLGVLSNTHSKARSQTDYVGIKIHVQSDRVKRDINNSAKTLY